MTAEAHFHHQDDPASSPLESSPDLEIGPVVPDPPQKRKGGRKPIYATSEERKQRNRQAQAAFRERRTEYIKHLEVTIKQNEETLQALQQNSQSATDEVSRLRHKIALLERVLADKGFDVDAELQATGDSPLLSPIGGPVVPDGAQTLQRSSQMGPREQKKAHGVNGVVTHEFARVQMSPDSSPRGKLKPAVQRAHHPPPLDPIFQAESPLGSAAEPFPHRIRTHRQSWHHPPHSALDNAFDTQHHATSPFDFGPHPDQHNDMQALTDYTAHTSLNNHGPGRQVFAQGHLDGLGPESTSRHKMATSNAKRSQRSAGQRFRGGAIARSAQPPAQYACAAHELNEHDAIMDAQLPSFPVDRAYHISLHEDVFEADQLDFPEGMEFPPHFPFSQRH